MWRYRLFFSAQPVRVILEALTVGGVIWFVVFALMEGLLKTPMPVGQLLFVMGVVTMPWCALRLNNAVSSKRTTVSKKRHSASQLTPTAKIIHSETENVKCICNRQQIGWWWRRLREIGVVGVVCLAQGALIMVKGNTNFLLRFSLFSLVMAEPIRVILMIVGVSVLLFCGNYGIFLLIRAIGRIWTAWNHLRRTQLQWSLTHAHAMVVGMGTILLMAMAAVVLAISSQASFARLIIPIFAIVCILGVMAILAIIPPSALFSYMVVRKTVRRIQMLTEATSALRAGNYAVRVPVLGEDEVAQLQADFNAMAANLEQVMKELQQERDTVSGLLQSRRELVANASHELRTPVATLRGSLETTLMHWEGHSESRLQQDFLVMENEVMHLQTLVENLFTLARADVGRLSLRCEPTEIGLLVERVVKSRAPLAWQAGKIEMVADIQRRGGKAEVDSTRIEQILQNLLHNAERHTGPGGIIVVVVEEEQGKIRIQIKDTGEGIAKEELSSIWERAYRRSGDEEGQERETVGLGLALVKEWTEAMGGQISVESVQGEGSCFSVEFAAIQESGVAERPGALSEIK